MDITYLVEHEEFENTHVSQLIISIGDLVYTLQAHYTHAENKQNPISVFTNNIKLNTTVTFRLSKEQSLLFNPRHQCIKEIHGALFYGKIADRIIEWLMEIEKMIPVGKVFEPYITSSLNEMALRSMITGKRI